MTNIKSQISNPCAGGQAILSHLLPVGGFEDSLHTISELVEKLGFMRISPSLSFDISHNLSRHFLRRDSSLILYRKIRSAMSLS